MGERVDRDPGSRGANGAKFAQLVIVMKGRGKVGGVLGRGKNAHPVPTISR